MAGIATVVMTRTALELGKGAETIEDMDSATRPMRCVTTRHTWLAREREYMAP